MSRKTRTTPTAPTSSGCLTAKIIWNCRTSTKPFLSRGHISSGLSTRRKDRWFGWTCRTSRRSCLLLRIKFMWRRPGFHGTILSYTRTIAKKLILCKSRQGVTVSSTLISFRIIHLRPRSRKWEIQQITKIIVWICLRISLNPLKRISQICCNNSISPWMGIYTAIPPP